MNPVWNFLQNSPNGKGHSVLLDEAMPPDLPKYKMDTHTPIWAITLTLTPQFRRNSSAVADRKIRTMLRDKFVNFKDIYYCLFSEWSPAPKLHLHYHGIFIGKAQQMVLFREYISRNLGFSMIKECFDV